MPARSTRWNARVFVWLLTNLVSAHSATAQVITTTAGTNFAFPSSPLPALNAPLGNVTGVTIDASGSVYVADPQNNLVMRFVHGGQMTVVAGNGIAVFSGDGGPATNASLNGPTGVAVDSAGNLYIADTGNNRIRKVSGGNITTVAGGGTLGFSGDGGPAASASLFQPTGVALDPAGNLYIADFLNNRIRKVSGGTITTVAGNGTQGYAGDGGPALTAALYFPQSVALDSAGNLYVSDVGNHRIRKVSGGTINTFAGNGTLGSTGDGGPATSAEISFPDGIALDSAGNLYIADTNNNRIREVSGGTITTIAGNGTLGFSGDGSRATSAALNQPYGIAVDSAGNFYFADQFNGRVREVSGGTITTIAGTGTYGFSGDGEPAPSASLNSPGAVAVDSNGNVYIADQFSNRVRKVSGGVITTIAGDGNPGFSGDGGLATSASLNGPRGVAVDSAGNVYIADLTNGRVRKVSGGIITTVAGGGSPGDGASATSASISPIAVALDLAGNLYIADYYSSRIRKVSGGTITTVAGNGTGGFSGDGGPATSAMLNLPEGVAVDTTGNLYIADWDNNRIRKVSGGTITTVAGGGSGLGDGGPATSASITLPGGVGVDSSGNLYIADTLNNRIRKVTGGIITTVAGNGKQGFSGDGGPATSASLSKPQGLAFDSIGNFYIADTGNNRIREVQTAPPTFTASPPTLSFTAVSAGLAPPAQVIHIAGSVPNIAFTAQENGMPWLTLSTAAGKLPFDLQVSVDPSQLAAGTYSGTIVIAVPGAGTAPINVQVSFTVTAAAAQKLALSDQSLSFSLTQGALTSTLQLTLTNQGSGLLNFTASVVTISGGNWISISPASGAVTAGSPVSITVAANPGTLAEGTYTSTIIVASATTGQSISIPATLTVTSPPQKIVLSQLGFTFIAVAQGGSISPQSLGILNGGSGSMSWTAQTITASGSSCGWLNLSAASGMVTRPSLDVSSIDVSVNAQGLALPPGSYYCLIQVSAPNAGNSPQSALAVLDMLPAGSNPGPNVQPSGLVFTSTPSAPDPGSKTVLVTNVTGVNITYGSAVAYNPDISPWLKYLPLNATVTPNQPAQIVVQPDFGSLVPGVYRAALTLVFNDGEIRSISVLAVIASSGTTPIGPASESGGRLARTEQLVVGCSPSALYPIFTQLGVGPSLPAGWPSAILAEVVDDCGNAVDTGSVVASFDNGDPPLSLTDIQNGRWSVSWTPGVVKSNGVTVTLKATSANLSAAVQETIGLNGGQSQPIVGSLLSPVTLTPGPFAPGDLMLIQGSGLASSGSSTLVLLGGQAAPLLYTNPSQVIALVPVGTTVNSTPQVAISRDTSVILLPAVNISATHPAILSQDATGRGQGLIYNATVGATTLADASNPAQAGAKIIVYCSGLGAVDALGNATNIPKVSIGGAPAPVTYWGSALPSNFPSGGAPTLLGVVSAGLGGLYQITATVPAGLAAGPAQVIVTSANQTSQSGVTMMITGTTGNSMSITSVTTAYAGSDIAQNTWIAIKGSNLVPSTTPAGGMNWNTAPEFASGKMPSQIGSVSVTIDGKPGFVSFYCSATTSTVCTSDQINVLTPLDSTLGPVQIVVNNNGALSPPFTANMKGLAPSFPLFSAAGYIVATHANNSLLGPAGLFPGTTPANPGETIVLYAFGFGLPANSTLTNGSSAQSGALTPLPVCQIGGAPAEVGFAGLIDPGLYQLNVTVPVSASNGDNAISCTYNGSATPVGDLIAVQQ